MYSMQFDIIMSVVAFFGLASLIVAYVDYVPKWTDYLLFAIIFGVLGLYASASYKDDSLLPYVITTAISYAIGAVIVLFFKAWYVKKKQARE